MPIAIMIIFSIKLPSMTAERATAILAGGCSWRVEHDFGKLDRVIDVFSG